MGWYGSYNTRLSDEIAGIVKGDSDPETGAKWTCIAHCLRGMALWTVMEYTKPDTKPHRYIQVNLLRREEGGYWMYKPISEDMGPCEVSCPLSYLDMVPEIPMDKDPHLCAFEWRLKVRQWNAQHSPKWKVGQALRNWDGGIYYVKQLRPFRVTRTPGSNYVYSAKKSQFTAVDEEVLPKEA